MIERMKEDDVLFEKYRELVFSCFITAVYVFVNKTGLLPGTTIAARNTTE